MPVVTKLVQGYSLKDLYPGSRKVFKKRGKRAMRSLSRNEVQQGLDEIIQDRVQDEMDRREAERQAYWEEDRKYQEAYWERMDEKFEDDQYDPAYEDWKEKQAELDWEMEWGFGKQGSDGFVCHDPYCQICGR